MFIMKKLASTFSLIIFLFCVIPGISQNAFIEELYVLDSSYVGLRFDRQSLIMDNSGNYHLFYISPGDVDEYLIQRTSSDNGVTWSVADTISVYSPSSASVRFLALSPSATVDEDGDIHILYEYRGLPLYHNSYEDYPPSHMNYVYKAIDHWVTEVDVINDYAIQSAQGNPSTVCYLFNNQIANFNGVQHYIGFDYAWWGTQYNIVHSDNSSGEWSTGSPLYTYNLGSIDNRILNAPSLIQNDDSLYAIWYQAHECNIEMKAKGEGDWTESRVLYNDVYIPKTPSNQYGVGVSSYSNGSEARITMFRAPETDFNELLILSKSVTQPWIIDTLMLSTPYSVIRPTIAGDTTLLFLVNSPVENNSFLMKYFPGYGKVSKLPIVTSTMENRFNNIVLSDKTINPIAYMVYDAAKLTYYLKIGRLTDYTDIEENNENNQVVSLSQNYPNPFSDKTTISYSVNSKTRIKIDVFNAVGVIVANVVDDIVAPGSYSIELSADMLAEGIYYYSLVTDENIVTKKMMVVDR